jgi:predicted DNA-binding transcriptional regulator YafY
MAQTTARVLQLLGLLQSRPVWSGAELAERLGVTERSVRRDVERLRELGYPVGASKGVGGGYRLGAGRALPPLLLDADEAVAVAVCLRLAAGGTVAGVGEAALRTLTKLDQVLPGPLRAQVAAVHDATVTIESRTEAVDPDVLLALARSSRDRLRVRFEYVDRAGEATQRVVEPYRMVATGRRWYLLAYDVDREDWRTFRLDRMRSVEATTWVFTAREAPDAREFVARAVSQSPYRYVARVRFDAPAALVAEHVPATAGTVEPLDDATCVLTAGADHLDHLSVYLAAVGADFAVLEPPELRDVMADLAGRLGRAAARPA